MPRKPTPKKPKPRKPKRQPPDLTLPIFQLKITLQDTDPPIWRQVHTDDCSLDDLHEIIQTAMGWADMHAHAFVVDGEDCGDPRFGSEPEYDSRFICLKEIAEEGHLRFLYDYDFGDDWRHVIDIEKTLPAEEGVRYPRCVAGERACPPEDCGGPPGYDYLLEKVQDPDHEEHEEALEWIGDGFDPEKFDPDAVNKVLYGVRRWLGRRRGKPALAAAFAKGDLVRGKPGTAHEQYPDIPLGGWVGKVTRVAWLTPRGYAVHWTEATLGQAPAVYFKRCRRDELKPHRCWLEEGQLEAASDETPVAMEQPTNIVTRPLSMDEPDDRIRAVFGLTSDDGLPKADEQTQRHFLDYLKAHLSFPFDADYWTKSDLGPTERAKVTLNGFADPPLDRQDGILCEARTRNRAFQIRLAGLQLSEDDPNAQYVEDYTRWLWKTQDDLREDEAEEPQFPVGTVACYGPDDAITTKIVAGIISEEGAEPIIKRWVATDVTTNPKVRREIDRFFKKHAVKRVAMSQGNMGCPHEEGKDFPLGGDCPFCPWWKAKQGSGAKQ
jgi:hypothetical protein